MADKKEDMKGKRLAITRPDELRSDLTTAIEKLTRAQELMTQLRALILPTTWSDEEWPGRAVNLFEEALMSFSAALSVLTEGGGEKPEIRVQSPYPDHDRMVKDFGEKRRKNPEGSYRKRRRHLDSSWTVVTSVPLVDGHQWRKYGQKQIDGAKFPRNYYRCTHKDNQGCQTTKIVQQKDNDNPPKYTVTYNMQHTCKKEKTTPPVVIDFSPREAFTVSFQSNSLSNQQFQHPLSSSSDALEANHNKSSFLRDHMSKDPLVSEFMMEEAGELTNTNGMGDAVSNQHLYLIPCYSDLNFMHPVGFDDLYPVGFDELYPVGFDELAPIDDIAILF